MTTYRLIGDIHRKWASYIRIIEKSEYPTIQLGDFGWGFADQYTNPLILQNAKQLEDVMSQGDHKYIRGNHDNPDACRLHNYCIEDGTYDEKYGVFYLGGAFSIDRACRTHGIDWWPDEELDYYQMLQMYDKYMDLKPRVMLTHDGPRGVMKKLFNFCDKLSQPSITEHGLQRMFEEHKPELWIFGHWHLSRDNIIDGTRFVCLAETEHCVVDFNTLDIEFGRFRVFD